jgi:dienelactone hydrolase
MKKKGVTTILIILMSAFLLNAQTSITGKPVIDMASYAKWASLDKYFISNNGDYVSYTVSNRQTNGQTLVLLSTKNSWRKEFTYQQNFSFTSDSRKAIMEIHDSLRIVDLGRSSVNYITHVNSFALGANNILVYKDNSSSDLVIKEISGKKEWKIPYADDYVLDEKGNSILVKTKGGAGQQLILVDLSYKKNTQIWSGQDCVNFVFDKESKQIAYVTKENNVNSWWYYKIGSEKPTFLFSDTSRQFPGDLMADANIPLIFNKRGSKIFFQLMKTTEKKSIQEGQPNLYIWSYKDEFLPTQQKWVANTNKRTVLCIVDIASKKVIELNRPGESITEVFHPDAKNALNDYLLVWNKGSLDGDALYNPEHHRGGLSIVSSETGKRELILPIDNISDFERTLSPDNRYLLYYNKDSLNWYSYEIATKIKTNLSKKIPCTFYDEDQWKLQRTTENFTLTFGFSWCENDNEHVLLYDRYDIWKVSLAGKEIPVNITSAKGKTQKIAFSLVDTHADMVTPFAGKVLLSGFNTETKENGYWWLRDGLDPSLEKATMGEYAYFIRRVGRKGITAFHSAGKPIRAKDTDVYILPRMSAAESSNLFITKDFKKLKQISFINPEKDYNWVRSELITWKMSDGKMSQGILYKPENFDKTKKYPLIFNYYEKRSDDLNNFLYPRYATDEINIPTYVSNGYLVFVPDIYFQNGHNGMGVIKAVLSAVDYLSNFSWVDSTRMGLQGHSFGGWETNYIITHSKRFAAACESAGVSNLVSSYGQVNATSGDSRQMMYEFNGQGSPFGKGVTPWTSPDLYIENSPIFNIGEITTPLLMRHSRNDPSVPFEQALELFLDLRRAGKKVWFLENTERGHSVGGKDMVDYTIRMRQFFDYYLKGTPPPRWMTEIMPATEKGISDKGYELDYSGKKP